MDQQISLEAQQSEVLVPYWTLCNVLGNVEVKDESTRADDIGYLILLASTCTLHLTGEESIPDFTKPVIDRMLAPLVDGHPPARAAIFENVVKWVRADGTSGILRRPALMLPNKPKLGKHLFRSVWDLAAVCAIGETYICDGETLGANSIVRQADELTELYCSDEADENDLQLFLDDNCPIGESILEQLGTLAEEAQEAVDDSSESTQRYAAAVGLYRCAAEIWNYAIVKPARPKPFTGMC